LCRDPSGTFSAINIIQSDVLIIKIELKGTKAKLMLEINNCYKLLHLEEDCSDLELRRRYRKCALESHPDRIKLLEVDLESSCHSAFIDFNEAYRRIVLYRKQLKCALKKSFGQPKNVDKISSKNMKSFE
jgi:DnaJ-class molecular chaperone